MPTFTIMRPCIWVLRSTKTHASRFLYSYGPDKQDEMRDRLVKSVDVFHDVRTMTDLQIVKLAREERLDIATN